MSPIEVDGASLSPEAVERVAVGRPPVRLPEPTAAALGESARWYDAHGTADIIRSKWAWLMGGPAPTTADQAVRAFIEGHCAGVGEPLVAEQVRALLLVRANVLAVGHSGVRPALVERMVWFLNEGWVPVVPCQGSVGAAGCVALAHVARVLLGLGGEVETAEGDRKPVGALGLPPLEATEKEALSLINGSSLATALAALAVARARRLLASAEAACALSFEAIRADVQALSPRLAGAGRHPGIARAARHLRELVDGSELVAGRRRSDSFSVRCAPMVLGAVHDALDHIGEVVTRELNGVSDNPMVFAGEEVLEGGYFHGASVALAMDHLKVALAQLAGIAERRIFRLTYGALSGLPSFLVPDSGVNSGLMLAQYTAASLVSETKSLAVPASVDSVPTVQHQEDHVPMAPHAARGALEVIERVYDVVAIELLCAAQAVDLRMDPVDDAPASPGDRTRRILERVREVVPRLFEDRVLHPDLAALGRAVRAGRFSEG